jgi:hypothetical protein
MFGKLKILTQKNLNQKSLDLLIIPEAYSILLLEIFSDYY